jgi:carbamoyl-phosphate synthase large subunit
MREDRPNIEDAIKNGEIQLIINTPNGRRGQFDDSCIRKAAIKDKIPCITTTAAAAAVARGIEASLNGKDGVESLQTCHRDISAGLPEPAAAARS